MSNTLVPISYTAQRMAARMIEALCRLGFEHKNGDGSVYRPTFSDLVVYGQFWLVCEVDAGKLWHYSIADLATPKVTAQLSAVLKRPVKALRRNGLYYVIELEPYQTTAARLPGKVLLDLDNRPVGDLLVPIGQGHNGRVWRPLPNLGHTLIMGASGSGKSTWIHAALAALLTSSSPDLLQVCLIDAKQLELSAWGNAPHLRGNVVWDLREATNTLADLALEMDERGDRLAAIGARDLAGYNRKADQPLPYILAVIDEALDLTLQAGDRSEFTTLLKRIASKGRATGLYLWLGATHGTADVLPRLVSVNLASRVVFRVNDAAAARVAGVAGAQSIPRDKPGRLYAKLDSGAAVELQGFYLDDDDLHTLSGNFGSKPPKSPLTQQEAALIRWALENNDGYLSLADIQAVGQLGQMDSRRLAQSWERRGWLEKDSSARNKRRVTQVVCKLVESV